MTLRVRDEATLGTGGLALHPPTVGLVCQLAVLAVLGSVIGLGPGGWLAGTGYAVVAWVLLTLAVAPTRADGWGPANWVTLARAMLIGGVIALVADSLSGPVSVAVVVTLAAVALVLDGVDGQVARRTGTASQLGARFDMETDSVLVLVLSVFVALTLGWWVLAVGLFRYGFAVAAWRLPWLHGPLPPRRSRKTVAAVQGVVLVVVSSGLVPVPVAATTIGLVLALLCWSFGRDVGWLWRTRQAEAVRA